MTIHDDMKSSPFTISLHPLDMTADEIKSSIMILLAALKAKDPTEVQRSDEERIKHRLNNSVVEAASRVARDSQ